MSCTVRILPRAVADRRSLFEHLAERSPRGALAWEEAYEACLGRLEQNPLQFPVAPEDPHFDFELRQFLFRTRSGRPYRGVFRLDGEVVTILRLRGHGQAPVDPDEVETE